MKDDNTEGAEEPSPPGGDSPRDGGGGQLAPRNEHLENSSLPSEMQPLAQSTGLSV